VVLLWKGVAAGVDAFARRQTGHRAPGAAHVAAVLAGGVLLLVVVPLAVLDAWQVDAGRDAIPPQFELAGTVFNDEVSGWREGCGVAVFRLSDTTLARNRQGGLAGLQAARLGRDGREYHRYAPWAATPGGTDERLFRGASCASAYDDLLEQAQRAAAAGGAFFTTGSEHDLVVVPSLGVIVRTRRRQHTGVRSCLLPGAGAEHTGVSTRVSGLAFCPAQAPWGKRQDLTPQKARPDTAKGKT